MKTILTGATGLIGSEVLNTAILHPSITSIIVLSRKQLPIKDPKLTVIVQNDFLTYPDEVLGACAGAEACVWSLGMNGMNRSRDAEEEYRKVNIDYTITAARTFAGRLAPSLGGGKKFRLMELQGELENTLDINIARPGLILAKNSFFPGTLQSLTKTINVDDVAVKVLDTAINGHKSQIIEVDVLRSEGKALKKESNKAEK
ncbi:MAG: hypothetical protein L6R41_002444 [Letrouitia leprolyta]|nr:MAG: hypothetical protein L6R41_002444 [Letrouitia leprolyta]